MFVVTGATGHTGSVVARTLLQAGRKVRVLVRDPAKAQPLAALGAEVVRGELTDQRSVKSALAGAEGLYLLSPPDMTARDFIAERSKLMGELAATIGEARVPHVVLLSSIGAQQPSGTGPILTVRAGEQALLATGLPVTFLRPAYFLQNWASVLPVAVKDGVLPSFLPASKTYPMISVHDIGPVAAQALLDGPRGTRIIELCGPRDLSPDDVAAIVAKLVGRPVKVAEAPLAAVVPTFTSFGISENIASLYQQMYAGMISGLVTFAGQGTEFRRGPTSAEDTLRALLPPKA
jgi:uncharacterized protein YbjT (DUF2867 family)